MRARLHDHAVAVALAGAVVAAGVWFVLASVTGLIFHFMPAAPTLAATSVLRWADGWPSGRAERTALLAAGASIALAMALVLAGEGRPLDEPVVTGIAILAGAVIGTWLLRPATRHAELSDSRPQNVGHHTVE